MLSDKFSHRRERFLAAVAWIKNSFSMSWMFFMSLHLYGSCTSIVIHLSSCTSIVVIQHVLLLYMYMQWLIACNIPAASWMLYLTIQPKSGGIWPGQPKTTFVHCNEVKVRRDIIRQDVWFSILDSNSTGWHLPNKFDVRGCSNEKATLAIQQHPECMMQKWRCPPAKVCDVSRDIKTILGKDQVAFDNYYI